MRRLSLLIFASVSVLLSLAACGGTSTTSTSSSTGSSAATTATTVQVMETEYKISSSLTSFVPGKAYHFVVTNNGAAAHEFMIMPKDEGNMNGMSMMNMDNIALAKIENVQPGQSATVNYTFPLSTKNSHPQFACYLPGHYEAGMKLNVSVQG